jgi:hypothetical protein
VAEDAEAGAYLASRFLDPVKVQDRDLARVLPVTFRFPRWARHWRSSKGPCYRLIFALYGATGQLETLRARPLVRLEKPRPKALPVSDAESAGLVLADVLGRSLLANDPDAMELVRRAGVWITEGEPDFLTLATAWSESAEHAPAVFGLASGAWTPDLAACVPDGTTVVVATDPDAAGEQYAQGVVATFADRMRQRKVRAERARWSVRGSA